MTRSPPSETEQLALVGGELARGEFRLAFRDAGLEADYNRQRSTQGHRHSQIAILLTIALFDLFLFGEVRTCPEVLPLSLMFRFAIVTPITLLILVLEDRGRLGRFGPSAMAMLIYLPTLFGCLETFYIYHVEALTNFQAIPLIQLAILTCRLSMRDSIAVVALSLATYIIIACSKDYVPAVAVPSLVLTDIAIAVTVLVFVARLDFRERQAFLLGLQSDIRRNMLSAQNFTLSRLTQLDALTGLGNRRCFDETLADLWSDQHAREREVTLVMFDIDCFKQFNDSLGHQAGDECLATLARAVARCLRHEADKLVRYGGEEFAIILPASSLEEGRAVAERVREAVRERAIPHPGAGPVGCVTVSLGVATVVPTLESAAAMIEAADRRLYAAKRAGRNIVIANDGQLPQEGERDQASVSFLAGIAQSAMSRHA